MSNKPTTKVYVTWEPKPYLPVPYFDNDETPTSRCIKVSLEKARRWRHIKTTYMKMIEEIEDLAER